MTDANDNSANTSAPAKTKKTAMAKKVKKASDHPKYADMVRDAISSLKERNGSSRHALLKYLVHNYKLGLDEKTINTHLKMSLKAGIKNGSLKQSKGMGAAGSFKLNEGKAVVAVPKSNKKKAAPKSPAKKAPAPTKAPKPASPKKKVSPKPKMSAAPVKPKPSLPVKKTAAVKPKKAVAKPKSSPVKKAASPKKPKSASPKKAKATSPKKSKAGAKAKKATKK